MYNYVMNDQISDNFWTWYSNIKSYKSNQKVSFNKPLTILFALGKAYKGERWIDFKKEGEKLDDFLGTFSKFQTATSCLYPLWRLRNDNKNDLTFWITNPANLIETAAGDLTVTEARSKEFKAGFTDEFYNWLRSERWRCANLIDQIIENTFTPTYEEPILAELGILDAPLPQKVGEIITPKKTIERDPRFRDFILTAYDNRCAFCDLKVIMINKPVAMEAAHVKWKTYGGECASNNGLCLCPTHHTTLDLGVWTLDQDYRIVLSKNSMIDYKSDVFFSKFEGLSIRDKSLKRDFLPSLENLEWHQKNIFR